MGEKLISTITLPFTNSVNTVNRLQRLEVNRKNKQRTIQFPTTINKALNYEYGDVLLVTLPRYKYVLKPFEVVQWTFNLQSSISQGASGGEAALGGDTGGHEGGQVPSPVIDLTLREINESVYL
jgi:hypothetical protein